MVGPRSIRLALAASFFIGAFSNCACEDDIARLPEPEIQLSDEQGLTHTEADPWLTLAFGDVDTGASATRTLTIANVNTGTLELGRFCLVAASTAEEASSDATACLQTATTPYVFANLSGTELLEGESTTMDVTFSPTVGGPSVVFLRVESNANAEPVLAVELTGRGTAGQLCAQNTMLDFGEVTVGTEKTLPLVLENCGVRPIEINEFLMLQNPDEAFAVAIDGVTAQAPIGPLAEGETVLLEVTFTPAQERAYRDSLAGIAHLTTAEPFYGEYQLLFLGTGVAAPICRVNVVPQSIQFGAVASGDSTSQQIIVQSVGDCACQITGITQPDPAEAGFEILSMPTLPFTLAGNAGCADDPADAATAPDVYFIDVTYTAPDRPDPLVDNATVTVSVTEEENPDRLVNLEATGGGAPFCQLDVTPLGGGSFGLPVEGRDGIAEFGRVTIYGAKNIPIELTNIGNSACFISNVEWANAPNTEINEFSLTYQDGSPVAVGSVSNLQVDPGTTQRFYARFAPTHVVESDNPFDIFNFGSYGASLEQCETPFLGEPTTRCNGVTFTTTDTMTETFNGGGVYSIGFQATPVEPAIDVIPGQLEFGLVTLGCGSPEQLVTVYNTGSGDLIVGEPYISPENDPADFVVTAVQNPSGQWPFTIEPGASMGIHVRYYANQVGIVTGELVIPTIEGDQEAPPVTVPLSGEGTLETEQTDYFDQFNDPKVDVLFVVDDSGSMGPFINQMADNFDAFFTASNVSAADYHIGVTTTLTTDGNCINPWGTQTCETHEKCGWYTSCGGNDRYITPTTADPEAEFTCNVRVSDSGNVNPSRPSSDSAEGALQAARKFFEPPNIDDPTINGGFLRDDAKLHIIMVSDEPDQSEGPVNLYIDFFKNIKGQKNDSLVAVSAIAVPDSGCTMPDGTALDTDGRYETVVNEMNGRFQEICEEDWTSMMETLGLDSLGLQIEFFLTRAADPATLEVCIRVDGETDPVCTPMAMAAEGDSTGWWYDPASNSIVFNPLSVPERGSRIEVHYETYCY